MAAAVLEYLATSADNAQAALRRVLPKSTSDEQRAAHQRFSAGHIEWVRSGISLITPFLRENERAVDTRAGLGDGPATTRRRGDVEVLGAREHVQRDQPPGTRTP